MNDTTEKKPAPLVEFKQNLARLKDAGEMDMLPANVSFEAFRNAAVVAVTDNPMILQANRESLFKAIRRLAAAGLVPDGREAALVPFKTKIDGSYVSVVQAMPMVFGLIKTARNSGEINDIRAHIVHQREVDEGRFTYVVGDEERLEHEPILFGDKGPAVAAYAIAKLKDGTTIREFMSAEEIDKVRRSGASQLNFEKGQRPTVSDAPKGIWSDWAGEMWKKTVIRRLCKRLPVSAEDVRRMMVDEDRHDLRDVTPEPVNIDKARPNLAQRLAASEEGETVDGEVVEKTPPQPLYADLDSTAAFPSGEAWDRGVSDARDGKTVEECPYDIDIAEAIDWVGGFRSIEA